jgi:flagellin
MRDLAVQASSDGMSGDERAYIDTEHSKLADSLDAVLKQAKFNGTDLIKDSGSATSLSIQAGTTTASEDTITIGIDNLSSTLLNVDAGSINVKHNTFVMDISSLTPATSGMTVTTSASGSAVTLSVSAATTQGLADALNASVDTNLSGFTYKVTGTDEITAIADASGAGTITSMTMTDGSATTTNARTAGGATADYGLAAIDIALGNVAEDRANLGAMQSQLESTVRNLANVAENTAAAAGRIMDTDYAAETANLTKAQILQQAATSVLAQANAQPQAVLSLLQ